MMKLFSASFLLLIIANLSMAQDSRKVREERRLYVYSITEYVEGYLITAIDTARSDTFYILTERDMMKRTAGYLKVVVGKEFVFDILNLKFAAPPQAERGHFAVRLKQKVVWNDDDGFSRMPVVAKNMKGLYITKPKPEKPCRDCPGFE